MKDLIADGIAAIVKFVFVWMIWNFLLFTLGRVTLLACTFGRYPRGRAIEQHANRIALTGLLVLTCLWSAIAIYNNLWPARHSY